MPVKKTAKKSPGKFTNSPTSKFTNSPIKKEEKISRKKKVTDEQIEEALRATGGIHRSAAAWLKVHKHIDVDRSTITKRIAESEHLQKITHEVVIDATDRMEAKLMELGDAGNITAVIFYLKCKAKDRGYSERFEAEISNRPGEAFKVEMAEDKELKNMPIEKLIALTKEVYQRDE